MGDDRRLSPTPDVVYRELEDSLVLVHLNSNRIYTLNSTGARVWHFLETGSSRSEIREQLLREFDVAAEDLDEELDQLLRSFLADGLVS
jgi:Coenzyme PQQ synthesis protein D (PqqD)